MSDTDDNQEESVVEILNPGGQFPCLLVCDHASANLSPEYGTLGLTQAQLNDHIGVDVGIAPVVRALSMLLDAPAVLSRHSRLLIDTNRWIADPQSIWQESDGVVVPGNQNLTDKEREKRQQLYFWPFHRAVHAATNALATRHESPMFLAIHSCARHVSEGEARLMNGGTIWHKCPRLAHQLTDALSIEPRLIVADNKPYSGFGGTAFTIDYHTWDKSMPASGFEIVNDELATPADQALWTHRLARAIQFLNVIQKRAA